MLSIQQACGRIHPTYTEGTMNIHGGFLLVMHIFKLLIDLLKIVILASSQIVRTYGEECYGTQFSPEISR
jgi:hypothetical protein